MLMFTYKTASETNSKCPKHVNFVWNPKCRTCNSLYKY